MSFGTIDLPTGKDALQVYTLGQFVVRRGGTLLSHDAARSHKLWDLFKYLLVNRGKGLLPESIVDTLWPEQEYSDPKRALRTQIYRLRQLLCAAEPADNPGSNPIIFLRGCYCWNSKVDCWTDADYFEKLCRSAANYTAADPDKAVALYREALSLYKGDFLEESGCSEWVIPYRNFYRSLYVQATLELTRILRMKGQYGAIIEACEKALMVEPFEEELHVRYLTALLEEGKTKSALAHYEYVSAAFYRELGVKPSAALRAVYRRIKNGNKSPSFDLSVIEERFSEAADGAFYCDAELFRQIYNLERRRSERARQPVYLVLLTVTEAVSSELAPEELKYALNDLTQTVTSALRKGDVLAPWNDTQLLIMLPGLDRQQADAVVSRIARDFRQKYNFSLLLKSKIQQVLPDDGS